MKKARYTEEQIAFALRQAETGTAVGEVIRSGRTITVCRIDAFVEKSGRRAHCATGLATLMTVTGRAAVKD